MLEEGRGSVMRDCYEGTFLIECLVGVAIECGITVIECGITVDVKGQQKIF